MITSDGFVAIAANAARIMMANGIKGSPCTEKAFISFLESHNWNGIHSEDFDEYQKAIAYESCLRDIYLCDDRFMDLFRKYQSEREAQ